MAYATLQDIRDKGVTVVDASDTDVLSALDFASSLVDGFCRQSFGLTPSGTVKRCDGRGHESLYFHPDYLSVLEDIKVDGVSILAGLDYVNQGSFLVVNHYMFPFGTGNVEVIGQWGRAIASMPIVKKATIELALDDLKPSRKQDAAWVEKQVGDTRVRRAVAAFSGVGNRYFSTGNTTVDDWLRPLIRVSVGIGAPNGPRTPSFSEVGNYLESRMMRERS